jgi:hypothetical protein
LTEGIDVPAVDMVAFIDPRHSKIDIAQATGRAMRKPQGSDKSVGYVVIPLHIDSNSGENLKEALERTDFSDVADVLNAMREQDEELIDIIRELQEAKGHGEVLDPKRLSEKVEVNGPSIDLPTLRSNIFAEIVSELGVSWDEWYGRLKAFKEREGNCRVPARYEDGGLRVPSLTELSCSRYEIDTFAALAHPAARDRFIGNLLYVKSAKCPALGRTASTVADVLQVTAAAKCL